MKPFPQDNGLEQAKSDFKFRGRQITHVFSALMLLSASMSFAQGQSSDRALVAEVRALLERGQPEAAYSRALLLEERLIGEPAFDFYFGLAAVESGKPSIAALAFERVLLAEPGSARVQLELGRALFQLGDLDGAQRQFNQVLEQEPPEGVRTTIDRFLTAIAGYREQKSRQFSWGFSVASGHDSNINSATSADEFTFALGTVVFPRESQKTDDGFSKLSGHFNGQFGASERSHWFFNTALESLANWSEDGFDTSVIGTNVGYSLGLDSSVLRFPVSFQGIYLDGEATRYSGGAGMDWSWPLSSSAQGVLFGQANALRNPENIARDSNLYVFGGGVSYVKSDWRTQFLASVSVGKDHALGDPVFGKVFANIRLGSKVAISSRWEAALDIDLQTAQYEEQGAFLTEREDVLAGGAFTIRYAFAQHWRVALRSAYTDNHSNLALYDFDRAVFSLAVEARW